MADFRLTLLAGALVVAGCSVSSEQPDASAPDEASLISCAIGSATQFTRNCSVERVIEDGVLSLVIWHEDGGFRRLRVMSDGSGVLASDGADEAQITVFDGEIEVTLGDDRYLLPATIADNGTQ